MDGKRPLHGERKQPFIAAGDHDGQVQPLEFRDGAQDPFRVNEIAAGRAAEHAGVTMDKSQQMDVEWVPLLGEKLGIQILDIGAVGDGAAFRVIVEVIVGDQAGLAIAPQDAAGFGRQAANGVPDLVVDALREP